LLIYYSAGDGKLNYAGRERESERVREREGGRESEREGERERAK